MFIYLPILGPVAMHVRSLAETARTARRPTTDPTLTLWNPRPDPTTN